MIYVNFLLKQKQIREMDVKNLNKKQDKIE